MAPNTWFCSIVGLSIISTPAKPAITATAIAPCRAGHASPLRVFRFRFPWLLATIGGGTVCAFLARAHEATLTRSLFVAFFLTLVLALNESVAVRAAAKQQNVDSWVHRRRARHRIVDSWALWPASPARLSP